MKQKRKFTIREKAIIAYFLFSLMLLSVSDETPILLILLVVLNFANAGRLLTNIKIAKED